MILFLYGEDTFRSRQKLNEIKQKFSEKDPQGLNLTIFREEVDFLHFRQAVRQAAFLAKTRLVIVENVFRAGKETLIKISEFFEENTVPESTIVVFWEEGVPDARSKFFKALKRLALTEEFKLLTGHKLNQWVRGEIAKRGGSIEEMTLQELVLRVGNDLYQMNNEIDKLVAYANKRKIASEDVAFLVRAKFENDIFKLVDALSRKDRSNALKFIHDQIALGANELYLLSMIVYAFRNLLMVKDLVLRGVAQDLISRETKLHPFVTKKTLASVGRFSLEDLKKIYAKLLDLDNKIKKGAIAPDFGLTMLVFGVTV